MCNGEKILKLRQSQLTVFRIWLPHVQLSLKDEMSLDGFNPIIGLMYFARPVINVFVCRHDKNNRDMTEVRNLIVFGVESALMLADHETETVTIMFDMANFSMKCMDFEVVRLLVTILQQNYPEVLGVALVINAPFIFSACWAVIKPWLDPITANKVKFVNTTQLLEYIDKANLCADLKTIYNISD